MKQKLNTTFDAELLSAFDKKAKEAGFKKINSALEFLMTKFIENNMDTKKTAPATAGYNLGQVIAIIEYSAKIDVQKTLRHFNQFPAIELGKLLKHANTLSKDNDAEVAKLLNDVTLEDLAHKPMPLEMDAQIMIGYYHRKATLHNKS